MTWDIIVLLYLLYWSLGHGKSYFGQDIQVDVEWIYIIHEEQSTLILLLASVTRPKMTFIQMMLIMRRWKGDFGGRERSNKSCFYWWDILHLGPEGLLPPGASVPGLHHRPDPECLVWGGPVQDRASNKGSRRSCQDFTTMGSPGWKYLLALSHLSFVL